MILRNGRRGAPSKLDERQSHPEECKPSPVPLYLNKIRRAPSLTEGLVFHGDSLSLSRAGAAVLLHSEFSQYG